VSQRARRLVVGRNEHRRDSRPQRNETFTLRHVVTPLASGDAVTGLFFDFDEIAALLLRPI